MGLFLLVELVDDRLLVKIFLNIGLNGLFI